MKILVATRNKHKLREIEDILQDTGVTPVGADAVAGLPAEVVENGATFGENALLKARTMAAAAQMWTIADDSGLMVDFLAGAPGVHSARYAGKHGDNAANNRKLLAELRGVTDRRARFCCALALVAPDGRAWQVEGFCEGRIGTQPVGQGGFGYDPLFIPDGFNQTFAELTAEQKNQISHRAAALRAALAQWRELLVEARS